MAGGKIAGHSEAFEDHFGIRPLEGYVPPVFSSRPAVNTGIFAQPVSNSPTPSVRLSGKWERNAAASGIQLRDNCLTHVGS